MSRFSYQFYSLSCQSYFNFYQGLSFSKTETQGTSGTFQEQTSVCKVSVPTKDLVKPSAVSSLDEVKLQNITFLFLT